MKDTTELVLQCVCTEGIPNSASRQTSLVLQATYVVRTIIISLGSTRCWNPFSLHSIAIFIDRSNILVRSFTYLYVNIVLAAYTVLMLQEDS
jgi:hypothetical protein